MSVLRSPHDLRLSGLRANSTAAASAIALILVTVAVSFVTLMLMTPLHSASRIPQLFPVVDSIALVAFATLSFGYGAGIVIWLGLFAAHRAGVHRLAIATTARPRSVSKD